MNHADLAAQQWDLPVAEAIQILVINEYLTLGGTLQHHDQFQQGGFARPGMTGQKRQLPGGEREAHLAECVFAVRVAFADPVKLNHDVPWDVLCRSRSAA